MLKLYIGNRNVLFRFVTRHSITDTDLTVSNNSFFQWNATTSYNFEIPREFGTDYGICCWYTPQLNFTEILEHQMEHNLTEPDWSNFFLNIKKVRISQKQNIHFSCQIAKCEHTS